MKITCNRIYDTEHGSVKQLFCPKNQEPMVELDTIVLHYTASGNAMSSAQFLIRSDVESSAHLVIGRDGRMIQLLPFTTQAWHAGLSSHRHRTDMNRYSIGIELQNAGQLHKRGEKYFSWFNKEYPESEVYTHREGGAITYWHNYPLEQLVALDRVVRLLLVSYDIKYILRHSDITTRKLDPGPAFAQKWISGWEMLLEEGRAI